MGTPDGLRQHSISCRRTFGGEPSFPLQFVMSQSATHYVVPSWASAFVKTIHPDKSGDILTTNDISREPSCGRWTICCRHFPSPTHALHPLPFFRMDKMCLAHLLAGMIMEKKINCPIVHKGDIMIHHVWMISRFRVLVRQFEHDENGY